MMNEGRKQTKTTIRQSMSITKEDVTKWVLEKGAVDSAHELKELVHELSEAVQEATNGVFKKHPECAVFFGVRGRVEIVTSVDGKSEDALGYLGFGPGCSMEYVEELERWSKEKSQRCRNCSSGECECGSDDIPSPAPKIDKLMRSLKALKALREIMDDAAGDTTDEKKEDEE